MISGKSPDGLGLDVPRHESDRRRGRISIRFRKKPVVAIIAGALLWVGLIAVWRMF